ncbi:MAG: Uncharacterized protein Athens071426_396 [Parcubacteria group bacterium Athens0714_26]|nr:MAG: Uncharacterized protein Athens071426_396 [Parcubacteria group bacterium Athens0714_26]
MHKRWIMRFNSTMNEEPHQGLKSSRISEETSEVFTRDGWAGDAWLSSVRDLNCSLKWGNERNPYCLLQFSGETAPLYGEEGEDDAKSACPSDILGYTHDTMAGTMGREGETWSKSHQSRPQFGLRSATRPHEAGIASNRGSAIPR